MTEVVTSALLPVHAGIDPSHLRLTLDSLLAQTRAVDEIVVVQDGPLSEGLLVLLEGLQGRHPRVLRIPLATNQGAGAANQTGLEAASGTWIVKVDADDVLMAHRVTTQLAALEASGADVCGAAMLEFETDPEQVVAVRRMPSGHDNIARRMRTNNPINHPTAVYRRTLALEAGGYPGARFMQDYVLFARLLAHGAIMTNLDEPLVRFRAGADLHRRRSASGFAGLELALQRELYRCGVVGRVRIPVNLLMRLTYRRLPPTVMRRVHQRVLARRPDREEQR